MYREIFIKKKLKDLKLYEDFYFSTSNGLTYKFFGIKDGLMIYQADDGYRSEFRTRENKDIYVKKVVNIKDEYSKIEFEIFKEIFSIYVESSQKTYEINNRNSYTIDCNIIGIADGFSTDCAYEVARNIANSYISRMLNEEETLKNRYEEDLEPNK